MESINCKTRNIFQLTTSHRGRPAALAAFFSASYFNSLPHTEVDFTLKLIFPPIYISTHYLTQRQTMRPNIHLQNGTISTHYLTQRQTFLEFTIDLLKNISTHYLTQRQTKQHCTCTLCNRKFQLTTSHRGRHQRIQLSVIDFKISTHYLTQRQTLFHLSYKIFYITFQLTTSHRGRRFCGLTSE